MAGCLGGKIISMGGSVIYEHSGVVMEVIEGMQSGGDGGDEHRLYVQSKVLHHGKQPGHCQMSDSAVRHLWAPKSLVEIRASGTLMKLPMISIDQCNYDSATLDNCTNSFVPSLFICKARHILHLDEPLFLIYGIYPSELMQVRRPHLGPGPHVMPSLIAPAAKTAP